MPTTNEMFLEAQKLHQAMRFADAETQYRRVIQMDTNHIGAWHHLGMVCLAQNKLDGAADGFQCVLTLAPTHVDAMTQLGIVLARQNKLDGAVAKFRQAIELRPQFAKAHNNLGVALTQMGKRDEALACYKEAASLQPDYAEAHFNLGIAHAERREADEAIACYHRAIKVRPDYAEALFNLGLLLVAERRSADAVAYLEQAVRFAPDNPEAHNNLCLALAEVGRFEEAVASSDAALRLRPLDSKCHMNRGNALASLGRIDAAIASYDLALQLQPEYPNAHWNRSLSLLAKGNYERGWAEYEFRWKKPETFRRSFPKPWWDGSSLSGKTILLWCEQGIGDTFQFVRYAWLLKEQGATVWLECPEKIADLLATCRGVDKVFAEGKPIDAEFDFHMPLMSLPHYCNTKLNTVPAHVPYLSVDADRVSEWRIQLGSDAKFRIGISWQGNPKHRWDPHRSIPLHWFRSLAMLDGVELYSLQKDHGLDQFDSIRFPLTNLRGPLDEKGGTFREAGAAMAALDLIITCDSALAHLAGALGLPVWISMAALSDWRWLRDRDESPWYPTMRLFRQSKLGEWRPVFENMCREVLALRDTKAKASLRSRNKSTLYDASKVVDWPRVIAYREQARADGRTVVWTNGCFDLLHVGHVRNLQAAKARGDLLIVGLNSDASVSRLKGKGRPILPETERAELLASLACVDYVVIFNEDTPETALARLEPEIHCKGTDYAPPNGKPIPEEGTVKKYGGRIEFLPLVEDHSTSDLVNRIRSRHDGIVKSECNGDGR